MVEKLDEDSLEYEENAHQQIGRSQAQQQVIHRGPHGPVFFHNKDYQGVARDISSDEHGEDSGDYYSFGRHFCVF